MAKRGRPVNGKGNWHRGMTEGRNGFSIRNGKVLYIRGIDMADDGLKIFKLDGVTSIIG